MQKFAQTVQKSSEFYGKTGLILLALSGIIYATITRPLYVIPLWVIYALSFIDGVRNFVTKLFKAVGQITGGVILLVVGFILEYRWVFFLASLL